jgi:glycosyltransferase involved in cell wall biosynthesis
MKILQLCNKPPIPLIDGGCIAINNVAQGLLDKKMEVKILTASTEKHPFKPDEIPEKFKRSTQIEGVFLDTRVNVIDAFSALVTADSYNVNRFFSPDFNKRLIELLEQTEYDIVHLESLFMTPYISTIRSKSSAKIVLRSHNLEHLIWERLAHSTGNTAKRMYLKHLASKLKKYEQKTINEVDGIAAISFEDTKRFADFKCSKPLVTIPFGIDLKNYNVKENNISNTRKVFHLGAMDWEPNKEAINWFIDTIWPIVRNEDLSFHLAGRNMPSRMEKLATGNFIVHGEVDSAKTFMQDHDIMVVPLLSGSGMRIKIIEAMALGKAVISTTVGAEGIAYKNGENIIIADSAENFAKAIVDLCTYPEKVKKLGKNARQLIENHYDNALIIEKLISFYQFK